MAENKSLAGKKAVVTGAGRGIGRQIALTFAQEGADLAILARTHSELSGVAKEIRAHGVNCEMVLVDLADPEAAKKACGETVGALGSVDILVNNAGADLAFGSSVGDSDPHDWWLTIEINVRGVYLMTHHLLPHINEGGKIINMSSGMGLNAVPNQSSYVVSKAGLHIFTECLAQEIWPRGIDVNNLVPGPVATDIFNRKREGRWTPEQVLEKFKDELPPGFPPQERIKHPQEVADLALYMATRPKGGPTGQTFSLGRRPF